MDPDCCEDRQCHQAGQCQVCLVIAQRKKRMERRVKEASDKEAMFARLARSYGVENHPRLSVLNDMAWDMGHSAGMGEVEGYWTQLVTLIK